MTDHACLFFILFSQLLYSRLLLCKDIGTQLAQQELKDSVFTVNPIADQLGLVDASGPRAILAVAASIPMPMPMAISMPVETGDGSNIDSDKMAIDNPQDLEHNNNSNNNNNGTVYAGTSNLDSNLPNGVGDANGVAVIQDRPEAHFYGYLLDACEKLFEGEMDQAMFEENTRFLFGTKVRAVSSCCSLLSLLLFLQRANKLYFNFLLRSIFYLLTFGGWAHDATRYMPSFLPCFKYSQTPHRSLRAPILSSYRSNSIVWLLPFFLSGFASFVTFTGRDEQVTDI